MNSSCNVQGMFVRRKRNKSGSISVQIIQKQNGRYKVIQKMGSSDDLKEVDKSLKQAQEAIP